MRPFQKPITGQNSLKARVWLPKRSIVADPEAKFPPAAWQKMPCDLLHQSIFVMEAVHNPSAILSAPCPLGQGTVPQALYQKKKNTGLTPQSAETNMQRVANQGSRFRSFEVAVVVCGDRE